MTIFSPTSAYMQALRRLCDEGMLHACKKPVPFSFGSAVRIGRD
jgi:hypothetical protein